MNKFRFRFLVIIMSLSLIGIILVQLHWINTSYQNNETQFKHHVTQVIGIVAKKLQDKEKLEFYNKVMDLKNQTGKFPDKKDFKEIFYIERDSRTNDEIIYSNTIILEDYNLKGTFFDKKGANVSYKKYSADRKTEVFNGNNEIDNLNINKSFVEGQIADKTIVKQGGLDNLDKISMEVTYHDVVATYPLEKRLTKELLQDLLKQEFKQNEINTNFEFAVFSNGLSTAIKSNGFVYKEGSTFMVPLFEDVQHNSKYQLYVSFPHKSKFLFSDLLPFVLISLLFTFVIIAAYFSAIKQLILQRQISEIKSDFINNMTHEFKTPIATINLALDAIKNPKVISDADKVNKYLQMIRDENKRMHAQIENILRISRLDKKELDLQKDRYDVNELIELALDHVNLIVEDRGGVIDTFLKADRTFVLVNQMHFTNVLVNILDNAIKYSPEAPRIEVYTENVKNFILIKIKDHGSGMSKAALKRVFEKFYREHTGDLHNVKGHGLGLSYVKQIIDEHNGQVFAESEKGKGSTFIIKLPLIN